jgi:hypothetical protein
VRAIICNIGKAARKSPGCSSIYSLNLVVLHFHFPYAGISNPFAFSSTENNLLFDRKLCILGISGSLRSCSASSPGFQQSAQVTYFNPTILTQRDSHQSQVLHHQAQVRVYGPYTHKSTTTKTPPRSSPTARESYGSTPTRHRISLLPTSPGPAAVLSSLS